MLSSSAKINILVTGSAGFIGHHLVKSLSNDDFNIVGIDSINSYYDTNLKLNRLKDQGIPVDEILYNKRVTNKNNISFLQLDLTDNQKLIELFNEYAFDVVIHLAAQAGVRYSLEAPMSYVDSNLVGFVNILEACRHSSIKHLIFASSSSVYGYNQDIPFKISHNTDYPVSFYAATKKANELIAHSYAHLYNIPCSGLRLFTVYGPYGRPDMAYYSFTKAIVSGVPINVFNHGDMMRDFTYIDDITTSIKKLINLPPKKVNSDRQSLQTGAPYKIYNVGNSNPVKIIDFINTLEELLGKKALLKYLPMQDGDVPVTYADVNDLQLATGYKPHVILREGLSQFVNWYKQYYQL